MINWVGLYLERLERFSRRALISIISKINISIIIVNIAKSVWDFYVHLDPIYLPMCGVGILVAHPVYMVVKV